MNPTDVYAKNRDRPAVDPQGAQATRMLIYLAGFPVLFPPEKSLNANAVCDSLMSQGLVCIENSQYKLTEEGLILANKLAGNGT